MSEQNEVPYVIVEKSGTGLGAFIGGAVVGAIVALLYAPRSGAETQAELKEGVRRLREDANRRIGDLREEVGDTYGRVREDVSDRLDVARDDLQSRTANAEEAVRVGRDAARKAREDLERRVAETKAEYRERISAGASEAADTEDVAEAIAVEEGVEE